MVEPQRAEGMTIGFNDFGPRARFKASLFYTRLKNELYYHKTGIYTGDNTNIDRSYKYGLEIENRHLFSDAVRASLNYAYTVARIDEENEEEQGFGHFKM